MKDISILIVEDNPMDVVLIKEHLSGISSTSYRTEEAKALAEALQKIAQQDFDVVLLDLNLPDSKGFDTVRTLVSKFPQSVIIILTSVQDEQLALQAVQHGAQDYIEKVWISAPLLQRAIAYAIERKKAVQERETMLVDLSNALSRIEELEGMLPICTSCKKIRDNAGQWEQVELYLKKHPQAHSTHSICPDCLSELSALATISPPDIRCA